MVKYLKFGSLFILGLGVFILMQAFLPIISYQVWELRTTHQNNELIAPLVASQGNGFLASQILGVSVEDANSSLIGGYPLKSRTSVAPYQYFSLSIPKIKVEDATVKVDSEEAQKHLVLLPGMPLPGEVGNVFIAGHSN